MIVMIQLYLRMIALLLGFNTLVIVVRLLELLLEIFELLILIAPFHLMEIATIQRAAVTVEQLLRI